jgi:hypothetical protein
VVLNSAVASNLKAGKTFTIHHDKTSDTYPILGMSGYICRDRQYTVNYANKATNPRMLTVNDRFIEYCNAHTDLKTALCGGATCTTTA